MFAAQDYRTFAIEYVRAARKTRSDERRKHFLDMAKLWTRMAASVDDKDILKQLSQTIPVVPDIR